MNQYLKYTLTVAVTAAAMVAYQYEGKPEQAGLAQQAPNHVPIQGTEIKNEIACVEQPLNATAEPSNQRELTHAELADVFANIKKRLGVEYDPMLIFASAKFTDAEIEAYNRLHVVPFNPVVDEVCSEFIEDDYGLLGTACKRVRERGEHPYASVPIDELEELAVSDAAAALFMGQRSADYYEGIGWHLRATALSGKTGPLMKLLSLGLPAAAKSVSTEDEEAEFQRHYILGTISQLAKLLGDPRANPDVDVSFLRSNPELSQGTILAAESLLAQIKDIQAEVGVSTDA